MIRRVVMGLCLLASVAGCVRLSQPAPQMRVFRLDYTPAPMTGNRLPVTLRVPPFDAAAIYDREPIVYRDDTYSTGTYSDSRWAAHPGQMLADLLARDLSDSALYAAVKQGPSPLSSDYQLSGQVEEIEERATATPGSTCAAHLRLRLLVLRVRSGSTAPVLLQKTYADDAPCPCNDPRSLAAAMSLVAEHISAQLQRDAYDAIAADVAAAKH